MAGDSSLLRFWLGRRVAVVIDRPLGSRHPRHRDIAYPINYGYIPNTEAGDLDPIDAYVLGVDVPVSSFIGEVVAVVVRRDDVEDKLVVAPAGARLGREEIAAAVRFQERFFDSEIVLACEPNEAEDGL
jgi:inorganic pyrophosphatase